MKPVKFVIPSGQRLTLLFLTYVLGLIITSVASAALTSMGGPERATAMLRIATVVQDIFMLVLPAVITAVIVTRNPAGLLAIDRLPSWRSILLAIAIFFVSSPLMTWIIELNASISLPESLAEFEQTMRAMEQNATTTINQVIGPRDGINLVISILIIGVLAGLSEELLFRGALQRLLSATKLSRHGAIWVAAIIFSAIHFQFFGFVPRMLLGAFFGYLLLWSGSLWLPIIAHIFNNTIFLILRHITGSGEASIPAEVIPTWISVAISAIATASLLYLLRKSTNKE